MLSLMMSWLLCDRNVEEKGDNYAVPKVNNVYETARKVFSELTPLFVDTITFS